jgi:thioredoxin-related protein
MLSAGVRANEPVLTEDGLYAQPWFLQSLLELKDDLEEATTQKKRFAIMWELKGCPACKETHLKNFSRADIADYVKGRFNVLQLNIIGARDVVDFDGESLPEKKLAEKYGVRGTPTFQFFGESVEGLKAKPPRVREAARGEGYMPPAQFLAMFRFVAEKGYEKGTLADFLKAQG